MNTNRGGKQSTSSDFRGGKSVSAEGKTFDKKRWREQKYSKKYKLDQWENKRKRTITREYRNQIKDVPKFDVQKIYEREEKKEQTSSNTKSRQYKTETETEDNNLNNSKDQKPRGFQKAKLEYQNIKSQKKERQKELAAKEAEREKALAQYKAKKFEKYKKLSQRTKKGQPLMKGRLQLMLQDIEASINKKT